MGVFNEGVNEKVSRWIMKRISIVCLAFLFIGVSLPAAVITVDDDGPADCNNIQDAITLANPGDVILVEDGLYTGPGNRDIDYLGKAVTVKSAGGPANCILDCQGAPGQEHFGFLINGYECVLEGFTVTGGFSTDWYSGGAINLMGPGIIRNCIFVGNYSRALAGAVSAGYGCAEVPGGLVVNCTFYDNASDQSGSAVSIWGGSVSLITLKNCISWGNTNPDLQIEIRTKCGVPRILTEHLSILQGGWYTDGGIDDLPCLVIDPNFADPQAGDFHLKSEAGRWDPALQQWVPDEVTSPGVDAGDPAAPVGLEPAPNGNIINLGAYGGTPEASKSTYEECLYTNAPFYDDWVAFGKPDCWCYARQCKGDATGTPDYNKSGYWYVGTGDLNVLLSAWQVYEPPAGPGILWILNAICADFDHKAQCNKIGCWRVGTDDLNILLAHWQVLEPPSGPGIPVCPLDWDGNGIEDYQYWTN